LTYHWLSEADIFRESLHQLFKGYKIVNHTNANNPLSGCKLTKERLMNEFVGFRNLEVAHHAILSLQFATDII